MDVGKLQLESSPFVFKWLRYWIKHAVFSHWLIQENKDWASLSIFHPLCCWKSSFPWCVCCVSIATVFHIWSLVTGCCNKRKIVQVWAFPIHCAAGSLFSPGVSNLVLSPADAIKEKWASLSIFYPLCCWKSSFLWCVCCASIATLCHISCFKSSFSNRLIKTEKRNIGQVWAFIIQCAAGSLLSPGVYAARP